MYSIHRAKNYFYLRTEEDASRNGFMKIVFLNGLTLWSALAIDFNAWRYYFSKDCPDNGSLTNVVTAQLKIWKFSVKPESLKIECNGIMVLTLNVSKVCPSNVRRGIDRFIFGTEDNVSTYITTGLDILCYRKYYYL